MKNLLGLLLSTLLLFTPALAAEPPSPQRMDPPLTPGPFKAGEILVKFKGGISPAALASLLAANGLHSKGRLKGVNIDILAVPEGQELAAIAALRANPAVQFAEPNYLFYERPLQGLLRAEAKPIVPGGQGVRATVPETPTPTPTATPCAVEPDDPFYTPRYQWNLNNTGDVGTEDADIDAPEAWCVTTGSEGVVIALIDSGVDLQHPDLRDRIWVNLGEIADNGLDDDNNGYVDDVHGFDFADSQDRNDDGDYNDPGEVSDADPSDDNGLGTWAA
ncbi:MAG: S8 family serine peptidase, partial [Anaerolineae bacterium]